MKTKLLSCIVLIVVFSSCAQNSIEKRDVVAICRELPWLNGASFTATRINDWSSIIPEARMYRFSASGGGLYVFAITQNQTLVYYPDIIPKFSGESISEEKVFSIYQDKVVLVNHALKGKKLTDDTANVIADFLSRVLFATEAETIPAGLNPDEVRAPRVTITSDGAVIRIAKSISSERIEYWSILVSQQCQILKWTIISQPIKTK